MSKKKQTFCPYKEYWFGSGEEAQAMPAGLKFKRGSLLRLKNGGLPQSYNTLVSGRESKWSIFVHPDSIFLLLNYDSINVRVRATAHDALGLAVAKYVDAVEHVYTLLVNEKIATLSFKTWGNSYKSAHNDIWQKVRKPRKPPKKKRKKPADGFSFDNPVD